MKNAGLALLRIERGNHDHALPAGRGDHGLPFGKAGGEVRMDKSELTHLKELAEKASTITDRWYVISHCETKEWDAFIAAANPATIVALIADIERQEAEIKRLEAENARWQIEAHDLDRSGAETMKECRQLEKEADWLAGLVAEQCKGEISVERIRDAAKMLSKVQS